MTDLQVFHNDEFGEVRTVEINGEPWFVAADVAKSLGYRMASDMLRRLFEEDKDTRPVRTLGGIQNMGVINESGVYAAIFGSKLESAQRFKHWVTAEGLPTIRKTGGYIANEELFINTYLPYADDSTKDMFRATLVTVRKQNEIIQKQQKEIEHKEDVIIGLVDEISLAEKRQILNRLVRYKNANYKERWATLYREFENKYHINLSVRLNNYNKTARPKCKSKLDYIDKVMGKLPELYEIAVKLYENAVKALVQEMYYLNDGAVPQIEAIG